MEYLLNTLYLLFLMVMPLLIIKACGRFQIASRLGPHLSCYALGFILSFMTPVESKVIQSFAEIILILAIPLFLFSSNLKELLKTTPKMLLAFSFSVFAVFIASLGGSFLFRDIPFISQLAASITGLFTGGTVNLSALSLVFNMPANTFILINTMDVVAKAIYLLILFQWGKPFIATKENEEHSIKKNWSFSKILIAFALAMIAAGGAYGLTFLFMGSLDMRVLFLILTIMGLLGAYLPFNKKNTVAYHLGDYFILIFCFALSHLVNLSSIGEYAVPTFAYISFVIITVIVIYSILCKIFKIDKEMATITHVASIYGPAFVVVYVDYLKKSHWILPGIAISLLGYTIGTFLGILVRDILVDYFMMS